ncbi:putative helicase mov-10-B.1 isoform X1 [Rhynchophorus ferrugineus]|uniref:putative helicase mov-10-B.1 isoform X1 n=1 Tax=Rhynchophorus ferrugineus TaxID=354439 RepID=UPI003FCD910A
MACPICLVETEDNDDLHTATFKHKFNFALRDFEIAKANLCGNRYGVELSIDIDPLNGYQYDFTEMQIGCLYLNISSDNFRKHNNEINFLCKLKNKRTRNMDPVYLTYCGILHPYRAFHMEDPTFDLTTFKQLLPGADYIIKVKFKLDQTHVSNYKIPIYFTIQTVSENEKIQVFSIAKSIVVAVHDDLILDDFIPIKSPFRGSKWESTKVIPSKFKYSEIEEFQIPPAYMSPLFSGLNPSRSDATTKKLLKLLEPGHVTINNYEEFFHILLWLEETCEIVGLSCYNMENVRLKHLESDMLQLLVPGLAEKRPSIIVGDKVEIKVHGDHTSYIGRVERIEDQYIYINHLNDVILSVVCNNPEMDMDVRFHLGRIHLERMHIGVHNVVASGYVKNLFPKIELAKIAVKKRYKIGQNDFFNGNVYNNPEQLNAVEDIVNNTSRGAPYLVYGPPGTGKTVTIVEAILQLKKLGNKKIMVCAPSNAACNMLTEKLTKFCKTSELKRIMSQNADLSSVHKNIIDYCNIYIDGSDITIIPVEKQDINKYSIVITTLVLSGKYTGIYYPDVLFIDEAAQAREPEACCAIGLLSPGKQLVLAGDPQQLGPTTQSDTCKSHGYEISLFERLYKMPIYQHPHFMTMLKLNFRSNKDVIDIPNKLFYNNQLRPVSKDAATDPICGVFVYRLIVNDNVGAKHRSPIEFCSVIAKEQRQGRSPSYYNNREILMVSKYVEKLTSFKFDNPIFNVKPQEIGVVTPYIRQVYKIRENLKNLKKEWNDIDVGTTEAFQGREKRVIIISTVRAQEDLLLYDRKYKLGFVGEAKRFNVAVTRAKSKLIVVGNPMVLHTDSKFTALMEQAREMGTLCGAPFVPRTEVVREDILRRFNKMYIKDKQIKS